MSILSHRARFGVVLCTLLAFSAVTGCQDGLAGHRIIARMNDALIDQDQFVDRMQRVNSAMFDQTLRIAGRTTDPQLDSGAVALISILRETAIDQLAKQKSVVPSDDSIDSILNYARANNPTMDRDIRKDPSLEPMQKHNIRLQEEVIAIGTDGAKVDDQDLKAEFAADKAQLDVPERVGLRVLGVNSESEGQTILNQLKATGDFKAAERQEQKPPPFDGSEQYYPVDALQKSALPLYDAVKGLNPGQFAPAPISLSLPNAAGQPQSLVVIAQLTNRVSGKVVTLDQVRPLISQKILQKRFPQMNQHVIEQLNDFLQNQAKNMEIYPERYRGIVLAYLLARPQQALAPTAAQGGTPMPSSPPDSESGAPSGAKP